MARVYKNNSRSTLASGISDSALSITVAGGDGSKFDPGGGNHMYATLYNLATGAIEIVQVDSVSTDTLTIPSGGRGKESTTPSAFSAGDIIDVRPTAASLTDIALNSDNLSGLANAATARTNLGITVGTADAEYVTNSVLKDNSRAYTKAQLHSKQTLAWADPLTWDVQAKPVAELTLTANITSLTINNFADGGFYTLRVIQGGSGSYTITWPAAVDWGDGAEVVLSTAVGKQDIITFHATNTKLLAAFATGFGS